MIHPEMTSKALACKCGCNKLWVYHRDTCNGCQHNRCSAYDDAAPGGMTCGDSDCEYVGRQEACPRYESEASEGQQCALGDAFGAGCFHFVCSACAAIVDHCPLSEG